MCQRRHCMNAVLGVHGTMRNNNNARAPVERPGQQRVEKLSCQSPALCEPQLRHTNASHGLAEPDHTLSLYRAVRYLYAV